MEKADITDGECSLIIIVLILVNTYNCTYDIPSISMSFPNLSGCGEEDCDKEGLREMTLDPVSDTSDLFRLLLLELWPGLPERPTLGLFEKPLLGLLLLDLSLSSSSSMAASNRLFRGPISPFSSRICLFCKRGKIMSHTRSSVNNSYTNSSMNVNEKPP